MNGAEDAGARMVGLHARDPPLAAPLSGGGPLEFDWLLHHDPEPPPQLLPVELLRQAVERMRAHDDGKLINQVVDDDRREKQAGPRR